MAQLSLDGKKQAEKLDAEMQNIITAIRDDQNNHSIRTIIDDIAANQRTELQKLVAASIKHGLKFQSLEEKSQDVLSSLLSLNTSTTSHIERRFDQLHSKLDSRDQMILSSLRSFQTQFIQNDISLKFSRVVVCFLECLRFDSIDMRYCAIAREHAETCSWVLRDTSRTRVRDSFPQWLETGSGIYWIGGKAGSGKSTLMKFIWNHPKTTQLLTHWARNAQLCSAAFFFWNSGERIQSAQEGLFRTLLYQLCKRCPELVPKAFPDEWDMLSGRSSSDLKLEIAAPKSLAELKDAFQRVIACTSQSLRMCIFIDGFDEMEGDLIEITDFMVHAAQLSPYFKVCLSSRPWPVFETSFDGQPSLRMQDLNGDDIRLFCYDKLGRDPKVRNLLGPEPGKAEWLVEEVVRRAYGVFLWVHLVVQLLIQGIQDGDDTMALYRRLLSLPIDLQALFQRILGQIEPRHREEASHIFQLFRANGNSLDILTMDRALKYAPPRTFDDVLRMKVTPLSVVRTPENRRFFERIIARGIRRLNSRCRGLLEINEEAEEEPDDMTMEELEEFEISASARTRSSFCAPLSIPDRSDGPSWWQGSLEEPCRKPDLHDWKPRTKTEPPDLLQVPIRYLHRSARDYIEQPHVWRQVLDMSASFDPKTALLAAAVVAVKMSHSGVQTTTVPKMTPSSFAHYLHNLDLMPSDLHASLVDDLDRVFEARNMEEGFERLGLHSRKKFLEGWENVEPFSELKATNYTVLKGYEIASTVRGAFQLPWYTSLKDKNEGVGSSVGLTDHQGLPLAFSAISKSAKIPAFLAMTLSWHKWAYWLSTGSRSDNLTAAAPWPGSISLLNAVISAPGHGPDSYKFHSHTLWEYVITLVHNLSKMSQCHYSQMLEAWILVFEVMLRNNADPCATCIHDWQAFVDAITFEGWEEPRGLSGDGFISDAPTEVSNHTVPFVASVASAGCDAEQWSLNHFKYHSVEAVVRDVFLGRKITGAERLLHLLHEKNRIWENLNVRRQDDADGDGGGVDYPHWVS